MSDNWKTARYVLDEVNTPKVETVASQLGISVSDVINRWLHKLDKVQLQEIVTFKVEVKQEGREDESGKQSKLPLRSDFATNW